MNEYQYHKAWLKYIRDPDNCPPLPKGYRRSTLLAYCVMLAELGRNGKNCYASNKTMGRILGIARKDTVSGYHQIAIQLRWFKPNGRSRNNVPSLDISIPADSKPPR